MEKTHSETRNKHHVLYCHVNTNNHYSSHHSVPTTHSITQHNKVLEVYRVTDTQQYSQRDTRITDKWLLFSRTCYVSSVWQVRTVEFFRGRVQGLEGHRSMAVVSRLGLFLLFQRK